MKALPGGLNQRLLRAIRRTLDSDSLLGDWLRGGTGARPALVIEEFETRPWASLTFSGARHRLVIRLSGPQLEVEHAYDRLRALLVEPEISLPGHFLADLAIAEVEAEIHEAGGMTMSVTVEALTIEE